MGLNQIIIINNGDTSVHCSIVILLVLFRLKIGKCGLFFRISCTVFHENHPHYCHSVFFFKSCIYFPNNQLQLTNISTVRRQTCQVKCLAT